MNRFRYARNNPAVLNDPGGTFAGPGFGISGSYERVEENGRVTESASVDFTAFGRTFSLSGSQTTGTGEEIPAINGSGATGGGPSGAKRSLPEASTYGPEGPGAVEVTGNPRKTDAEYQAEADQEFLDDLDAIERAQTERPLIIDFIPFIGLYDAKADAAVLGGAIGVGDIPRARRAAINLTIDVASVFLDAATAGFDKLATGPATRLAKGGGKQTVVLTAQGGKGVARSEARAGLREATATADPGPNRSMKASRKVKKAGQADAASFGSATSNDYRKTFIDAHPELEGEVVVHHAVEQQVLERYPGLVTEAEIHSLENLRGIPVEANAQLHLSEIRKAWNRFYKTHPNPTKQDLLDYATQLDRIFGARLRYCQLLWTKPRRVA